MLPGQNRNLLNKNLRTCIPVLVFWICALQWLFSRYGSHGYFIWYAKNGTLISVVTAFLALIWDKLDEQKGLLSWHPVAFLASCMRVVGMFYIALSATFRTREDGADDFASVVELQWDRTFSFLMSMLMAAAALCWLLVIAPGFYLLTLFTGSVARLEMSGSNPRILTMRDGSLTTIQTQPSSSPVPEDAIDVSFATRPFALTNALNAAVLFVANLVISHFTSAG